jgi:hypothetical protein
MQFGTLEVKAILQVLRSIHLEGSENYHVRWDNTSLPIPVDGLPLEMKRR